MMKTKKLEFLVFALLIATFAGTVKGIEMEIFNRQIDRREAIAHIEAWEEKPEPDIEEFREFIDSLVIKPAGKGEIPGSVAVAAVRTALNVFSDHQLTNSIALALLQAEESGFSTHTRARLGVFISPTHEVELEIDVENDKELDTRDQLTAILIRLWIDLIGVHKDMPDPSQAPSWKVSPPGSRYPAGISPEEIEDPEERQEYEKRIEENRAELKAWYKIWHKHSEIKLTLNQYENLVTWNILRMYMATDDLDRLTDLLDRIEVPEEIKNAFKPHIKQSA